MPIRKDVGKRPKCKIKGCHNDAQLMGLYRKDGSPTFRKLCQTHHFAKLLKKYNVSSMVELTAKRLGLSITDYANSHHKYRKYRKKYCENKDGRLGFKHIGKIVDNCQLTVDHIDGNHNNHNPKNLQTLCHNCHAVKTKRHGDGSNRYE